MSKKQFYRYCIVPCCTSSTIRTPNKLFFNVPKGAVKRKTWTRAMRRDEKLNKKLSPYSTLWCCEDHFSLPQDMENYWQWKLTKDVKRIFLKQSAIPHIFDCQIKPFVSVERSTTKKRRVTCLVRKGMSSHHNTQIPSTSTATSEFPHLLSECQDLKDDEEWEYLKDSLSNTLKKGIWRKSKQGIITFKEILDPVPKREFKYSVKHCEWETDISAESDKHTQNKDIKFPLVFVSVDSATGMPDKTAPLLYELKQDKSVEFVSDHVRSSIYSLCIEFGNSLKCLTNENSAVLSYVDEPFEATPNYTLDIPIKLEPLYDGYEDTPTQGSIAVKRDTSILPLPTQAFSYDVRKEKIDIKPNICKAGNSLFPLIFTLKASIDETSNCRTLIYGLKNNSSEVQTTDAIASQISSVQINSLSEANIHLKDASMLKVEGPLNITMQTEPLEVYSNTTFSKNIMIERVNDENMPVIIDVSSCSDHPIIADDELLILKGENKDSDSRNMNKLEESEN